MGLVDGRLKRERSAFGRADPRVVAAIKRALEEQQGRSTATLSRLRRQVGWLLEDTHGPGTVAVPPMATFNRLVRSLAEQEGLAATAAGERRRASRPVPVFTPTVATLPGELVMMDSTLLDVMVVCEDGQARRPELTMAVDVATRSITAAVLRPKGTKAVDAAVLLAQTLVPQPMRPNWPAYLSMAASVIPHTRLVTIDARMQGAAARPVIRPTTVVIDQGKVFVSRCFLAAAEHLTPGAPGNLPLATSNAPANGGVIVQFVLPNSNGQTAGLQPGDFITAIDGQPTPNINSYYTALNSRRAGATVPFTVQRAGQTLTLQVTLDT